MSKRLIAAGVFIGALVIAGLVLWPEYRARRAFEQSNRTIALAVDFEDALAAAADASEPNALPAVLADLKGVPVTVIALSQTMSSGAEEIVRSAGFSVLWQVKTNDFDQLAKLLQRVKPGDGIVSTQDVAAGYPSHIKRVLKTIKTQNAFFPVFEFLRQKGFGWYGDLMNHSVKAHALNDRETLSPHPEKWNRRFLRAADERGVRLFYLRRPPSYSWAYFNGFAKELADLFTVRGYTVGAPLTYKGWKNIPWPVEKRRVQTALALAVFTPLLGLWILMRADTMSFYLRFLAFCAFSVAGGIAVYLLGSQERYVQSLRVLGGVKAQLILPLVGSALLLIKRDEWGKWWETSIKFKHIIIVGGVIGFAGILYLMRSGNFPLIPVSDSERYFRDALENLFGARPRLKEFLIGHPALMIGFYLKQHGADARLWLLLGVIGQISIMNTFLHFHAPLELGLLRTFHGIWIGGLIGLVGCRLVRR